MKPRILLVEDEPDVVELVHYNLEHAGYRVTSVADGPAALESVRKTLPDLVILDLMLPEVDGLEVCRLLRRNAATERLPIIMLTAKASEVDRVVGLELGADDYMTKPFSPRELVLRVRKLLQRSQPSDDQEVVRLGALYVDLQGHEVTVGEQPIDLTSTEFNLLALLVRRRGRVQTREQLLQEVWGYDAAIDTRTVDTHMRRLRGKLGEAADLLETIRGVGYRCARR